MIITASAAAADVSSPPDVRIRVCTLHDDVAREEAVFFPIRRPFLLIVSLSLSLSLIGFSFPFPLLHLLLRCSLWPASVFFFLFSAAFAWRALSLTLMRGMTASRFTITGSPEWT